MDDLMQVLVYVAFLVIYLISKVLKNKKEKPVTRQPEEEVERDFSEYERPERRPEVSQRRGRSGMDEPERKPTTFDEILRELTGADQWEEEQAQRREEERSTFERQKEKAHQRADEIEQEVEQKADQYSKKLGDSVNQAKQARRAHHKNLKEIEKITEPIRKKAPSKKHTLAKEIARSLKDPYSAKRAIILSEIINRKHF